MQQRHEYMGFWDNVVAYVGIYIIDIIYCRQVYGTLNLGDNVWNVLLPYNTLSTYGNMSEGI